MTNYLSFEFLDVRPARLFDAAETVEEFASILESKAGAFEITYLSDSHPWQRTFSWFCVDRQDIAAARAFAYRRQGQYSLFWVPTWAADFLLLEPSISGTSTFKVHDSGKDVIRIYVAVITPTAIYLRQILGYTDNLDGTRDLELDTSIPEALGVDNTLISYLSLARLVEDEIAMEFVQMNAAEMELNWAEVLPLPL